MAIHVKINRVPDRDTILSSWLVYKKLCKIEADIAFSKDGKISVLGPALDGSKALDYIINNMSPTTFFRSINFAVVMSSHHRELHPLAQDAKYSIEEDILKLEGEVVAQAA